MARRRPEFVPGEAGTEAAKLKKFSAADTCKRAGVRSFAREAGGTQIQWLSDAATGVPKNASFLGRGAARTDFSITSGICLVS